ncbi:hypothetical protein ACX5I6_19870 [Arthrobacter sp. MMS24-T111]
MKATADDWNPVKYVEGIITGPPGTHLDHLKVQLTDVQSDMLRTAEPVSADGHFRVPYSGMDFGNLLVSGGDTGLANTWYGDVARQADATTITLSNRSLRGLKVTMAPGSTISGSVSAPPGTDLHQLAVVASSSFTPPAGVARTAFERAVPVASDGSYRITGLGADTFTVRVTPGSSGLLESWYGSGADKKAANPIQLKPSTSTTGINFGLTAPASLSGRIIFPDGAAPNPALCASILTPATLSVRRPLAKTGHTACHKFLPDPPGFLMGVLPTTALSQLCGIQTLDSSPQPRG